MATELARVTTPLYGHNVPTGMYHPPLSPAPYMNLSPSPHHYPLPLSPPPLLPYVDNGRVWLPSPSPTPFQYSNDQPHQSNQAPAFLAIPQLPLARPSSAEPTPSWQYFANPSGLPPSSVPQPLPALVGGVEEFTLREEGKGERASRITHHLRMSSRTRSVSPQSHRYTLPAFNNAPSQNVDSARSHPVTSRQDAPLFSPLAESLNVHSGPFNSNLSPSMGNVISPQPMHSPKHTVTVDPFTHATFNKSERVEVLERMAAETVASNADMSASVPDLLLEMDKTLPKPPVPSGKPVRRDERQRADVLFAPSANDDYAPPTPTLAAFSSPKASRAALGQLGGLDALEAKLLAEVGTRKVSQDRRPNVRTIMPITIPRPGAVPDPVVDSAISSLSLPGIGADEGTLRFEQDSHSAVVSEHEGVERSDRKVIEDILQDFAPQGGDLQFPKERVRKKSTPKPKIDDVKEKEQFRLRKAAQGRVTAWLGSIEPDVPPLAITPPPPSPLPINMEVGVESKESADIAQAVPDTSPKPILNEDSQRTIRATPATDVLPDDEPNPRSSGFMPLDTVRLQRQNVQNTARIPEWSADDRQALPEANDKHAGEKNPMKKIFSSRSIDPEIRYDIRSARGGRGGIVTAVAAIWASATTTQSSVEQVPQLSQPELVIAQPCPVKQVIHPAPFRAKANPPHAKSAGRALSPPEHEALTPTPTANLSTKRAKMIKSSSVPAVLSSSLATPMLSSTASLARPSPMGDKVKTRLPPILPGSGSGLEAKQVPPPKPLSPPNELAFGQARLRELIRKYQG